MDHILQPMMADKKSIVRPIFHPISSQGIVVAQLSNSQEQSDPRTILLPLLTTNLTRGYVECCGFLPTLRRKRKEKASAPKITFALQCVGNAMRKSY
jgi:hypothetical protein